MTGKTKEPGLSPGVRSVGGITVVDPSLVRRAVAAAAVGNVTEWFDFGVFAYMATTIGKVFYPSSSPTAQLLATFGTFAAAFLVRPIGGMFFGPLGDRIGRTKVLATTMIMMAAGTFCIGLIPSHATIGLAAPILLLLARLVQGFSTGGEYGGAMTFIAEYAPDRRRGFLGSWLEFGTLTGYIFGAVIVAVLTATMSDDALLSWGWRIPFLIAGPLGVVGMYLRLKLEETPAFAQLVETHERREAESAKTEFREIFVRHWPAMLICGALVLVFNVTNYMLTAYMPTYLSDELPPGISDTESSVLQIVVMAVMLVVITFIGSASDRFGRKPVIMTGCIALVVLSVPSVLLIQQNTVPTVFAGLMIMGLMLVVFSATMPSTLPALFPTNIRQGGLSVSFNISVSLFGGTVATVMTALIAATGDLMWPGYYLIGAGVIGAIGIWFAQESAGRPLPGSPASAAPDEEISASR
ncbi:MFS transporter [Saccharopolyspora sp. TS4A08]|uniref:MFS transporter n=1 Tax=Saccharopolyspora ipomoeae TaxID=3042027 RepID=A0ABT6PUP2_9PSEU|nr:MFS transporter [Saccharopolyspora sp. TS4A08]MDI2031373.1 MFS transporter [Saccharopolyspora sp. TS4A08]